MEKPKVSILTPVHNDAHYVELLIKSVDKQRLLELEHIIIDDGSTVGWAVQDVREAEFTGNIIRQKNKGQYAAMNAGLRAATGDVVCFVNQDDLIPVGAVSAALSYLHAHPEWDAVAGRVSYIDDEGKFLRKIHPLWNFPLWTYPYTSNIYHGALYIRREFLERHQIFFDPKLHYAGDYDWILRLLKAGISIGRLDQVLLQFRIHAGQVSEKKFQDMRTEIFEIARRHGLSSFLIGMTRKIFFLSGFWDIAISGRYSRMIEYLQPRIKRKKD